MAVKNTAPDKGPNPQKPSQKISPHQGTVAQEHPTKTRSKKMTSTVKQNQTNTAPEADETKYWEKLSPAEVLNNLTSPIMISDTDDIIRYVNDAASRMFSDLESEIRVGLPDFRANQVVGQSIHDFHKNPSYQKRILGGLTKPHLGIIRVGALHLSFYATPIMEKGTIRAVMVEWRDETAVKQNEDNLNQLIGHIKDMASAHQGGKIDQFIPTENLREDYAEVGLAVNQMVEDKISVQRETIACVQGFALGDFDAPFKTYPDKQVFVSDGIESVRASFKNVFGEIRALSEAIMEGRLDFQIETESFDGEYLKILNTFEAVRKNLVGVFGEIGGLSQAIMEGRLDVEANTGAFTGEYHEILCTFDSASTSLNEAFSTMATQIEQISLTVTQMSDASQALATNSQVQSTSVDEVSASAEETDSQVKANTEASNQAGKLVQGAADLADSGKSTISEMLVAIEDISNSSQDIGKIIKVIDEIAFQTNLLALNAAVEAARAGQHGRGFAVVAQEVRNLAGRSAKAARETSDLIEDAGKRVGTGVKIASQTSEAFEQIASDIDEVKTLVLDISTSSEEQMRGVEQINLAIGDVAKTALSTSQQADELAAISAQMQAATEHMRSELSRFTLRKIAPKTHALSGLNGLDPAVLASIQSLLAQQGVVPKSGMNNGIPGRDFISKRSPAPKANGANGSYRDQDERGFEDF